MSEKVTNFENPEHLFSFAFCGTEDVFLERLKDLAAIAEEEQWEFDGGEPLSILKYYILDTFHRCLVKEKILYSEDGESCAFNTGLLTKNSQDILGLFKKNDKPGAQKWKFVKFLACENITYMNTFTNVAPLAKYWDNYEELYYDPKLDLQLNIDHILDDNWDRIKLIIGEKFNKSIVKQMLKGAVEETKAKIERNMRLAVPQFYREKIMFLIPVSFQVEENQSVTLAMAVEKMNNMQYRANTIFTLDMAYGKARLLMKPESNWLLRK